MVTGATSLSLVRDELFTTIEETEQSLEQFIAERNNGSLLQQAVENLQQVYQTGNQRQRYLAALYLSINHQKSWRDPRWPPFWI